MLMNLRKHLPARLPRFATAVLLSVGAPISSATLIKAPMQQGAGQNSCEHHGPSSTSAALQERLDSLEFSDAEDEASAELAVGASLATLGFNEQFLGLETDYGGARKAWVVGFPCKSWFG